MTELNNLAKQWLKAKNAEAAAITARRALEDQMRSLMGVADNLEGVEKATPEGFEIKVTGRITRKVDGDRLQELAAEAGLSEHLSSLFRWKPELILSAWKATDKAITTPLAPAITAEPGRPSFSISIKDV